MALNPPEGMPRVIPYLLYEDVGRAIEWLGRAFGLTEKLRLTDDNGVVNHADVRIDDGVIMLGNPGAGYANPKRVGHATQLVAVYVDDVDEHFRRAKEAGATILSEPEDQPYGERRYMAEDPEGHQWHFATHQRSVPPEEWGAKIAN